MSWIGVQILLHPERGQTSDRCWMTKKLEQLVTRCSVDMGVGLTHWRGLAALIRDDQPYQSVSSRFWFLAENKTG